MEQLLLELLRDARLGRPSPVQPCDFQRMYTLSKEHEVSALVYNQIYHFPDFPPELKAQWSREALTGNALQTMRTHRMVQLCQVLRSGGIDVLVVKGAVLRSLYPQPENRPSNDEDFYIPLEQVQSATRLLTDVGALLRHEGRYENAFLDTGCSLSIELHGKLFDPETRILAGYQKLFENGFADPAIHRIEGVEICSLSHDLHFLFLMTHLAKHFLFSGVGIRQILDIVMYSEAFREQINWNGVYEKLEQLDLLTLTANVMEIGRRYFEMDPAVPVPQVPPDCDALLEDIMGAGIFGATSQARIHSAPFTLAAADGKKPVSGGMLLERVFPAGADLAKRSEYAYLREKPWMLPVAWTSRLHSYLSSRESGSQERETLDMSARRVALLRKYGVIK